MSSRSAVSWHKHAENCWFTQNSDYAGLNHDKPKNTTFIALVSDPDMGEDKSRLKTLADAKAYIESLYERTSG
jgi:hypothetical protein